MAHAGSFILVNNQLYLLELQHLGFKYPRGEVRYISCFTMVQVSIAIMLVVLHFFATGCSFITMKAEMDTGQSILEFEMLSHGYALQLSATGSFWETMYFSKEPSKWL